MGVAHAKKEDILDYSSFWSFEYPPHMLNGFCNPHLALIIRMYELAIDGLSSQDDDYYRAIDMLELFQAEQKRREVEQSFQFSL